MLVTTRQTKSRCQLGFPVPTEPPPTSRSPLVCSPSARVLRGVELGAQELHSDIPLTHSYSRRTCCFYLYASNPTQSRSRAQPRPAATMDTVGGHVDRESLVQGEAVRHLYSKRFPATRPTNVPKTLFPGTCSSNLVPALSEGEPGSRRSRFASRIVEPARRQSIFERFERRRVPWSTR